MHTYEQTLGCARQMKKGKEEIKSRENRQVFCETDRQTNIYSEGRLETDRQTNREAWCRPLVIQSRL